MKAFIIKHRLAFISAVAALSLILNFVLLFAVLPLSKATYNHGKTAALNITVKEAVTNIPLENTTVCVIETGEYYNTNESGSTGAIKVPVLNNGNFDESLPRPWGEVTVFVYKDGYIDFILFYVMVYEGKTRNGPSITLYPTDDPENALAHSLIESPDNEWVNILIKKYKK